MTALQEKLLPILEHDCFAYRALPLEKREKGISVAVMQRPMKG